MSMTADTKSLPEPEATELSTAAAPVDNKRVAASGVIPKRMQSWIFLSVLLVGALGLWFSSGTTKAAKPSPTSTGDQLKPVVAGLSPDEVQTRLKENEEASRNAAANSRTSPPPSTDGHFKELFGNLNQASNDAQNPLQGGLQNPSRDPIQDEERKREYQGRFTSNIALSYRSDPRAGASSAQPSASASPSPNPGDLPNAIPQQSAVPGLPADFQQQLETLQAQQEKALAQEQQQLAAVSGAGIASSPQPQAQSQTAPTPARYFADENAATGKQHVIFEGTALESV